MASSLVVRAVGLVSILMIGLATSLHLGAGDSVEVIQLQDELAAIVNSSTTQANVTKGSNKTVPQPVSVAGQATGMFVEVMASERTIVKDAAPSDRVDHQETPMAERAIFTESVVGNLGNIFKPRFAGGSEYLTGANFVPTNQESDNRQDGVPFPSAAAGVKPAQIREAYAMSGISYKDGNTTRREIYVADNNIVPRGASDETKPVKGQVRKIDADSGVVTTVKDLSGNGPIYSVAAQNIIINETRHTLLYTSVDQGGFTLYNPSTGTTRRLIVPFFNDGIDFENATEVETWRSSPMDAMVETCFTADNVSAYLHWKKKIWAFKSAACEADQSKCQAEFITEYADFKDGQRMSCAVRRNGASLVFYSSQGHSVVSVDLGAVMTPGSQVTTAPQKTIATVSKAMRDGKSPQLGTITGLSLYQPPWAAEADPYLVLTSGGQLKVMSTKAPYAHTLIPSNDGPVVALGHEAFFGKQVIFKSSLQYYVPCKDVNHQLARSILEWSVPIDKASAVEKATIELEDSGSFAAWEFSSLKKTANVKEGFMESTVVCMHKVTANVNVTREKHVQCCMTKFSKQHQGRLWDDQIFATMLY